MSAEDHHEEAGGEESGIVGGEAESTASYQPVVKLEEVAVASGEEDDTEIYKQRSALYRFDEASNEWKERGKGDVKLLKNKKTNIIRILLRQDKTLKVCCNHVVHPAMELRTNPGSDRSWVWRCRDFADEKPVDQTFAIRFKDADVAGQFKDAYNAARDANKALVSVATSTTTAAAPAAAAAAPASTATTTTTTTEDKKEEPKKEDKPADAK